MTPAKRTICVFLCVILSAVLFSTKASAITLDGVIGTVEWKNAEKTEIFSYGTNTNSDITFALMKSIVDKNNQAVYLAFQIIQKTPNALQPGNTAVGVRLNIKSGTTITCHISGADEFDHTAYSLDKSIVIGANNDFIIEMKIGYLFGVPANPLLGLQFIDGFGNFSNYYSFPSVETTASTTAVSTTKTTTSNSSTTKATTVKPTTASTTKVTTTKANTTNTSQRSTKSGATGSQANGTNLPAAGDPANADADRTVAGDADVTNENGEIIQDDSAVTQNKFSEQDENSGDESLTKNDSGERGGGIGIKKQIAAVAAAVILIGLAVYLCVLAAKKKPAPQPEPEKPDAADESELDDDF